VTFVLSGCLTVEDAKAAHRLATRGFWPRVVLAVVVISVVLTVLTAIAVSSRPYSPQASNTILLVTCVLFPALLIATYLWGRFRLRRFARQQYGMFAPTRSTFSPEKIVTESDGAKSELDWSLFSDSRIGESVALLAFKNSARHLILARSKLQPPGEWAAFVGLIESRLPTRGGT
jgi:hypothetical protein